MRRFIVASHAHFAQGIMESVALLVGEREDVETLSLFVDGNDNIEDVVFGAVSSISDDDELVVCTDILGGSVNNEFTKLVQVRPNTHLVTNMNLPLLITLLFADPSISVQEIITSALNSGDLNVKYVNDLLVAEVSGDDDF